jgi:hypothetical protein
MNFLRTASTRRLLITIAAVLAAVAAGAAIAVAATSGGPVPKPAPLPVALHRALAAPAPPGITARISLTNNLVSSVDLPDGPSNPLLSGASGRLWLTRDHLRIELQSDSGDAEIVAGGGSVWVYDPSSNTVYRAMLAAAAERAARGSRHEREGRLPTVARIQEQLNRLGAHLAISAASPTDVAGQPAYRVGVAPKRNGGLLGAVQLAWDAVRGVPLDFAVFAKGDPAPVLELRATAISYGGVDPSVFAISPPSGAKVVRFSLRPAAAPQIGAARSSRRHLAPRLDFALQAPAALGGMARTAIHRIDWGGHPAAVVIYGHGLGGLAVIEHRGGVTQAPGPAAADVGRGLALPTTSLGGATAQVLGTPLGTLVEFTRGGVSYVVAGSVPAATAEAAARDL